MSEAPVILFVSMKARPGSIDAMRDVLIEVAEASRREDGCEIYQLLQDPAKRDRFSLLERWRDEAAFKAHQQSEHLAQGFAKAAGLQAEPPRFERWGALN